MAKKTINDMFLTAREKSANNFKLGHEMIDAVDGMLRVSPDRIAKINEAWHLHAGKWPELYDYLGSDMPVFRDDDREGEPINLNDYITHHPKMNNVTNYIMGGIIAQPLIPIVKDFSTYGRKFREEERLKKARAHYQETIFQPQAELIKANYFQEIGLVDPLSLTPDEQKQVQSELQARIKSEIPRSVMDDMKKIDTPDEKIRQALLNYDIEKSSIQEKFILGGEQAVIAYEEYYKLWMKGVKPMIDVLNAKWVRWAGSENCDYSEDGQMAAYDQYLTPQDFVTQNGREVIKNKNFMKDIEDYFTEVPGYFKEGNYGKNAPNSGPQYTEMERDFVDAVGENPNLIRHDWRTIYGQQEIAALYSALSTHHTSGRGIREVYTVFKWTEPITYVQREEGGKINEYFFSADYRKDKSTDKMCVKFPISRVYHGKKVADRFYMGVEPVPWQFFGGAFDFEPKLTICGRRYAQSNGNDENTLLITPAIQYQLRYNITASKLEDLEKSDTGKITFWNTDMKPDKWTDEEYMGMMMKFKNVPYTTTQVGQGDNKPAFTIDAGASSKMEEYRRTLDMWENEMYKQCRVNRDALGQANPYQSNAQTQSNIEGSSKQLLPFHNRRRLVKQRVLNYFSNMSMLGFLEDPEKQELLLDDFSRMHLQINADDIKAHAISIFIVDDYGEAQNAERIKAQILTMLQNGTSILDVIDIMDAKSVPVMREIAQVSEIKTKEAASDAHQQRMQELQAQQQAMLAAEKLRLDRMDAAEQRKNQVNLMLGEMEAMTMENAADVDENKIADSLQRAAMEIASAEKIAKEANETKIETEKIKARSKPKPFM